MSLYIPQISNDWTAFETDWIAITQGDFTVDANNNYACDEFSQVGCKVQTQADAGLNYMDYTNNRTRFEAGGQAIVSIYIADGGGGNEYLVDSNNTCQSYCPLEWGEYLYPTFSIPADAKDEGSVVVNNKTYEKWTYADMVLKWQMDTVELLIDEKGNPYNVVEVLTPFNIPLGTAYSTYTNFVAGTPDAALFDVNGIDSCPLDENCQEDPTFRMNRIRNDAYNTWFKAQQEASLTSTAL
jgi:hypothetical protein